MSFSYIYMSGCICGDVFTALCTCTKSHYDVLTLPVGLRILSIREMVFTLCLILILDPFFSTNTMPLADF